MTCACPAFIESPNPRREACAACGKPKPPNPLPPEVVNAFFDRLREALEASGRLHTPGPGDPPDPTFDWYTNACRSRLVKGAVVYGERNFLRPDVDPITELLEEMEDGANYVLMELVKSEPDDADSAMLWSAACRVFGAVQDVLHYKAKRRGASG